MLFHNGVCDYFLLYNVYSFLTVFSPHILFVIVSRFLDSVPVTAIDYFRQSAEKLIEERGAVDALAAALAHISGATSLEMRSLLSSDAVSFICNTNTQQ